MKISRVDRTTVAVASSVVLIAVSACGGTSGSGGQAVSGGTLTIGLSADPGGLDPQRSVNGPNLLMGIFAYDTPVTLLDSGQLAPQVLKIGRAHV